MRASEGVVILSLCKDKKGWSNFWVIDCASAAAVHVEVNKNHFSMSTKNLFTRSAEVGSLPTRLSKASETANCSS